MTRRKYDSTTNTVRKITTIDLLSGWPNPKLLPPQSLRDSVDSVLSSEIVSTRALCYGPDEGYRPLREAIGKWLTEFYRPQREIKSDQLCITGGASQNLSNILQVFTDPVYTRNVWMVSPTYFLACRVFDDSGFASKLRAIPEDEEGIDIEYLAAAIRKSEETARKAGNNEPKLKSPRPWRKVYKHIIYGVPTFSNPSGRLMSLNRRQQLVRLARLYDALIITDDVYDMLQWVVDSESGIQSLSTTPLRHAVLPRIVDIDSVLDGGPVSEFGNAISNGTFSKIVAPGCRTGWAQGTPKASWGLSQVGSSRSGGCPSHFTSTIIEGLLATQTLQTHITETLIPSYSKRYHILLDAVTKYLIPLGCKLITQPGTVFSGHNLASGTDTHTPKPQRIAGGYFLYFTLPPTLALLSSISPSSSQQIDSHNSNNNDKDVHNPNTKTPAEHICNLAFQEANLKIIPGKFFRVEGEQSEIDDNNYALDIRLSFAWEEEKLLEEGVQRLGDLIRKEMSKVK